MARPATFDLQLVGVGTDGRIGCNGDLLTEGLHSDGHESSGEVSVHERVRARRVRW